MANKDHLNRLQQGVEGWNAWRRKETSISPDLREADLEWAELEGAKLEGANLERANLEGAKLERVNLEGANLTEANVTGAYLSKAILRRAKLTNVILSKTDLTGADLRRADLHGADLSGVNLSGAILRRADLRQADLSFALLGNADLRGADLGGADLSGAFLFAALLGIAPFRISSTAFSHAAAIQQEDFLDAAIDADLDGRLGIDYSRLDVGGPLLDRSYAIEKLIRAGPPQMSSTAPLRGANLSQAKLQRADLHRADLENADLSGADLRGADLRFTDLVEANFVGADLTGCRIYGISAWGLKLDERTKQRDLIITAPNEPTVTVDNIEVAQFVYLLLHNEKIRSVIDTIGKKSVLLLGRFTEGRIAILERLRDELRNRDFLPLIFNFDKPETKDFTETVRLLAGMSRFVIVDITNPRSAPLELDAIVPEYMIPFVPILEHDEEPFAMFIDLWIKHRQWVLNPIRYPSVDRLIEVLDTKIIEPAQVRFAELMALKAQKLQIEEA